MLYLQNICALVYAHLSKSHGMAPFPLSSSHSPNFCLRAFPHPGRSRTQIVTLTLLYKMGYFSFFSIQMEKESLSSLPQLTVYSIVKNVSFLNISLLLLVLFFYPHLRTCLLILETREGSRETRRETLMWERGVNRLPLTRTLTVDQTPNPGIYLPWTGIKPTTFQLMGWPSNQLSYLARVGPVSFWRERHITKAKKTCTNMCICLTNLILSLKIHSRVCIFSTVQNNHLEPRLWDTADLMKNFHTP